MSSTAAEPVQYAQTRDGIVIIRVSGKATHLQCPSLRYIFEKTKQNQPPPRYIIDMDQCTSLDSTFMGMLATMALHQRRATGSAMIVTNIQSHVRYLLGTLGLNFLLEMRSAPDSSMADVRVDRFKPAESPTLSPTERLLMMIEAHENLVDVDSQNELKFEGVLKHLRDSLERARRSDGQ